MKVKLRIVFVRRGYSPTGGAEAYLKRLVRGVDDAGHDVQLVSTNDWPAAAWPFGSITRLQAKSPIGFADDHRLPEWGFGITNLIARPTPGIDSLRPDEYVAGAKTLRRKIRRVKPEMVAFIGVTLFRSFFGIRAGRKVTVGPREERIEGARVFVLPNPSGRNANFSYEQMLDAFAGLRRAME